MFVINEYDKAPKGSKIIAVVKDPKKILPNQMFLFITPYNKITSVKSQEMYDMFEFGHQLHNIYRDEGYDTDKISSLDYGIGKSIKLCDDLTFELIEPNDKKFPNRIFIVGKAGSGKTTWCRKYLENYIKMYPKNPIYIISRKPVEDFSKLKNICVINMVHPECTFKSFEDFPTDCLVLFNDASLYPDKKVQDTVDRLRHDLLDLARSKNISVINTGHEYNGGKATVKLYLESTYVCVSAYSQKPQSSKMLKEKLDFEVKKIDELHTNIDDRFNFLLFSMNSPDFCLSDREVHML